MRLLESVSARLVVVLAAGSGAAAVLGVAAPGVSARPGTPPTCATSELRITLHGVSGGLDHGGFAIDFRNAGTRCVLRAYPGLDGVTASGHVVVHARRRLNGYLGGATAIRTVTLARGSFASALYEGLLAKARPSQCPSYGYVEITPPNDLRSVRRFVHHGLCAPEIHPVVPGRSGSDEP